MTVMMMLMIRKKIRWSELSSMMVLPENFTAAPDNFTAAPDDRSSKVMCYPCLRFELSLLLSLLLWWWRLLLLFSSPNC